MMSESSAGMDLPLLYLVRTKVDEDAEEAPVFLDPSLFATQNGAGYAEVSAKEGTGVDELFTEIGTEESALSICPALLWSVRWQEDSIALFAAVHWFHSPDGFPTASLARKL